MPPESLRLKINQHFLGMTLCIAISKTVLNFIDYKKALAHKQGLYAKNRSLLGALILDVKHVATHMHTMGWRVQIIMDEANDEPCI